MTFTFNDNSLSKVLVPLRTIFNVVKILDYGATKQIYKFPEDLSIRIDKSTVGTSATEGE